MDLEAMRQRCPRSRAQGHGRLACHRLAVTEEGTFTVARDPRTDVYGLLFDLALADVSALDRYEEIARGAYAKMTQPVLRTAGAPVRALIYVGRTSSARAPRADHLAIVQKAANDLRFPPRYIAALDRFVGVAPRSTSFAAP